MNNVESPKNQGDPEEDTREGNWLFFISKEEESDKLNQEEASQNTKIAAAYQNKIKWPDWPGWIVAVFTVVIAGVGIYQWHAIDGQLGEMKSAGKQTDQLICLYQQQLAQMENQATNTHELAVAAKAQSIRTGVIAETAKNANELAKETLKIAQRPYIVAGRKDGTVAEFIDAQGEDAKPSIAIYLQNSGHLPASVCVFVDGSAAPIFGGRIWYGVKRIRQMSKTPTGLEQVFEPSCPNIGGESVYTYMVPLTFSQETLNGIRNYSQSVVMIGIYPQYCDPFGGYVAHQIILKYFVESKAFRVIGESDESYMYTHIPDIQPSEYLPNKLLPPCAAPGEEEQNQKRFLRQAGFPN